MTLFQRTDQQPAGDTIGDSILLQLHKLNNQIRDLFGREQVDLSQIAVVGTGARRSRVVQDWPVSGARRIVVTNSGFGITLGLTAGTVVQALDNRETRLGGYIVNTGANGVVLYLGSSGEWASGAARPRVWLPPAPGPCAWNLLLGHTLWAGHVCAIADTGGSSISVAEV